MEQLRKIAVVCWNAKERFVLAIMVLLLGYRVYFLVQNQAPDEPQLTLRAPSNNVTTEPDLPPRITRIDPPLPITPMTRRSIFDYVRPSTRGGSSNASLNQEDAKVELLRIVPDGTGGYKAHISTGSSKKLIAEGGSFEHYTLMKIDVDTECVEIYSENTAQKFEVCK